jgi:hypothetical protein
LLAYLVPKALFRWRGPQDDHQIKPVRGRKRRASLHLAQTFLVVSVVVTVSSSVYLWHRYIEKKALRERESSRSQERYVQENDIEPWQPGTVARTVAEEL